MSSYISSKHGKNYYSLKTYINAINAGDASYLKMSVDKMTVGTLIA